MRRVGSSGASGTDAVGETYYTPLETIMKTIAVDEDIEVDHAYQTVRKLW